MGTETLRKVMTPAEFAAEMRRLKQEHDADTEQLHMTMDALMMRVLTTLGYGEGVEVFLDADKWYA